MTDQKFDLETASAQCPLCSQKIHILKSITDYGIFFLVGAAEGIYGTSCGACKKTVHWRKPLSVLNWLKGELGKVKAQGETRPGVVYDSFPYSFDYLAEEDRPPVSAYTSAIGEGQESLDEYETRSLQSEDPNLKDAYCSYFHGDPASGPAMSIWFPKKDEFDWAIKAENTRGIRLFPRYAPYYKSIEDIHQFCWTNRLWLDRARKSGFPLKHADHADPTDGLVIDDSKIQTDWATKTTDFLDLIGTEDPFNPNKDGKGKILKSVWQNYGSEQVRKGLSDMADLFIDEYIKTHQKAGVSYGDLIGLKYKYVEKIAGLAGKEPVRVKGPEEGEVKREKMSQAKTLIELASEKGELFKTPTGEVYVRVDMGDHDRIMEVGGDTDSDAARWIRKIYYDETGIPASTQNLKDAMATLESFDHPKNEVFIRVAGRDDSIYLDLANDKWEQVEITKEGWKVISNKVSPFTFKRSRGMSSLPHPAEGGSFEELRDLLNLQKEDHPYTMIVGWLVGAMHPDGPYPILLLQGEQGTAKSMTARMLRDLVDPWAVPLRTLPGSERDLAIAANANWILGFDNLSGLNNVMSDAFCRLSTGGGFATRALYTNKQETLFNAKRPLILNGIADIASRQDLAERSLIVRLPPIPPSMRKAERELLRTWEDAKPRILGCLCYAISEALRNREGLKMDDPGRMADFSLWVKAAEPVLPWEKGRFEKEYKLNRQSLIESAIETDPVASAILTLMESLNEWTGKPADLLGVLSSVAPEAVRRSLDFPKTSNVLSRRVNEAAGFLRTKGIEIERKKSGDRNILIRKVGQVPVAIETALENPSA